MIGVRPSCGFCEGVTSFIHCDANLTSQVQSLSKRKIIGKDKSYIRLSLVPMH